MSYVYAVMGPEEALAAGVDPDLLGYIDDDFAVLVRLHDDGTVEYVETDRMEPEDASFWRDLAWVAGLLNMEVNNGEK